MSQLSAFFLLPRPLNGLITALSVGIGALTADQAPAWSAILLAALSAALINGAGNAFNDLLDIDIDRINRPLRPLPSGRLSPSAARMQSLLLALVGCALAFWLSLWHGLIALVVVALLAVYSVSLKNSLLWGNVLVAFVGAIAFLYGALAAGDLGCSWIPALFAFLFHLGREIVKDIEDVAGDQIRGERTLPLCWGRTQAAVLAAFVYLAVGRVYLDAVFRGHLRRALRACIAAGSCLWSATSSGSCIANALCWPTTDSAACSKSACSWGLLPLSSARLSNRVLAAPQPKNRQVKPLFREKPLGFFDLT